jgi:peptidoglycan/xylan/chitin deacetylase (PgdA/CDA1 family)
MVVDQLRRIIPESWKRAATDHDFWLRARVNLLARPVYSGLGSILAFHRICAPPVTPRLGLNADLEVTPELLEETIKFFKSRNYAFVTLDQVAEILKTGKRAARFVAFTIDDGYADSLTNAYSIFKKYDVPFAVYVTTCFPNHTAILWWYVLEDLLLSNESIEVELDGKVIRYDCSTPARKAETFDIVTGHLTFAPNEMSVKAILKDYRGDFHAHATELAMSWEQVEELSNDPLVTIGAHSQRHLALSKLSYEEAKTEVYRSRQEIEGHIGKGVEHFAYPYGGKQAAGVREFEIVKQSGFKTATTTRNGNIFASHANNPECLPRIPVHAAALGKNIQHLDLWVDGLVPCHENSFQRVVTV